MTLNCIHLHKTELGFQIKVFACTVAYRLWARGLIGPKFRPAAGHLQRIHDLQFEVII